MKTPLLLPPGLLADERLFDHPVGALDIVEHCGRVSTIEQPEAVSARLRAWIQSAAG